MARGTQFSVLVSKLRNEVGRSDNVAAAVSDKPQLQQRINAVYEALYVDYDWPFLRKRWEVPLEAGERYYDFPTDLDYDRLEKVELWITGMKYCVERGIDVSDFVFSDPEAGDRDDPVQKWDIIFTGTKEQIEVWPVPASNDQSLWITGLYKFAPLVNPEDLCRLDDNLVVWTAAAAILARQESKDAAVVAKQAERLYAKLRGRAKSADGFINLGRAPLVAGPRPIVVRVGG